MSEVPRSLAELMLGIGVNASETAREIFGSVDPSRSSDAVDPSQYIQAAVIWRNAHIEEFASLAKIAERALKHLPANPDAARKSLASDLRTDLYGAKEFLEAIQPQYLVDTLAQAPKEDPEILKDFLQSLVDYSRLE